MGDSTSDIFTETSTCLSQVNTNISPFNTVVYSILIHQVLYCFISQKMLAADIEVKKEERGGEDEKVAVDMMGELEALMGKTETR